MEIKETDRKPYLEEIAQKGPDNKEWPDNRYCNDHKQDMSLDQRCVQLDFSRPLYGGIFCGLKSGQKRDIRCRYLADKPTRSSLYLCSNPKIISRYEQYPTNISRFPAAAGSDENKSMVCIVTSYEVRLQRIEPSIEEISVTRQAWISLFRSRGYDVCD